MTINYQKICGLTVIGVLSFGTDCLAVDCTLAPDCETLGYTKSASDCNEKSTVKCPFDTSKVMCSNLTSTCAVGSVLGNDQKCYVANNLPSSVKAVGIVFDVEKRLAMALTDVKQDGSAGSEKMNWSTVRGCDIPNLENCGGGILTCGTDGRANTDAILAANGGCNGTTTYAANAVNAYQTSNCSAEFCQKGKWFLPSARDLKTIYGFIALMNNVLTLLEPHGATNLQDLDYWSSTEYDVYNAWQIGAAYGVSGTMKDAFNYVRPVVKY